jgi:hypothetical protein
MTTTGISVTLRHEKPDTSPIVYLNAFDNNLALIAGCNIIDDGISFLAIDTALLVKVFQNDNTRDRLYNEENEKERDYQYRDPAAVTVHSMRRI